MSNGLNWDTIRSEYAKKAAPHELTIPVARKNPDPFAHGGRHTGSLPRYDRNKIIALYQQGWAINDIATEVGCHRSTVFNNLKAAGVQPGRKTEGRTGD